ncbi:hypothetical protein [Nocardia neocaledoniensis]|uniref:hypothetical protein n=1 Tax=Nocardia neocaledoniensis TaxID=236511 RepID=UPI002457D204|nr:hypothetical protein [Nocardia neocaledoniensis]
MSETIRVLVPDHMDLVGVISRAIEFAADLRHANDPLEDGEPWELPAPLVDAELQVALETSVMHPWQLDIGHDTAGRDTAIPVSHDGTGHMGLYVATATRSQLELLVDAAQLIHRVETTPLGQRDRAAREVAEFLSVWEEIDDEDASLSAWRTVVRILGLAIAAAPSTSDARPPRMYTTEGTDAVLVPTADVKGTSPAADTALVLARLDAGPGGSIDLDSAAWEAWQRLTAEWHSAIYGARANTHSALLTSWTY